jgi:CRISPR-associated exonuclease Cas4
MDDLLLLLGTLGVLLLLAGAWGLAALSRSRRFGRLVAVDDRQGGVRLASERYRIVGTPDEIRRMRDGREVPVEWKRRAAPRRGPPRSHQVQVAAYCLLLEETTGRPPPFGVLRYGDGVEFRLPWNPSVRAQLLALRAELDRPYDGRADPAPRKCAGCRWAPGCDARAP